MEPIPGVEIRLPPAGSHHLLRELHRQLRDAILDGRLKPSLRLPPTRTLAAALGVSRNTVLAAYDLLLGEGYAIGRPGAGTYVATVLPRRQESRRGSGTRQDRLNPTWRVPVAAPALLRDTPVRFDLRLGTPDLSPFPADIWRRLTMRAVRDLGRAPAAYAEPEGRPALREAIARHTAFARAVACGPDDIVVTAGAQQAFDLLARILVVPGQTVVAVEDPGYPPLRQAFAAAGGRLVPVPVDVEGLMVERLPPDAGIVCVTPSHQFPLGVTLSAARRAALINFARSRGALVIEDDYDGEFRFGGRSLDALQTLDGDEAVFYVGTFSKSLFPALRLGFVAAPAWARPALTAAKKAADWHCPVVEQNTLAAFIAEGHLARHVRRMRGIYARRRAVLLEALVRHGGGLLEPIPSEAGLHLAAWLAAPQDAEAIVARAAADGVAVEPLGRYTVAGSGRSGLALGYGACPTERIDEAIARLVRAINDTSTSQQRPPVR
ncbi:MAG TPA: PLP-dependent aminotransferase family protein [Microvirga sp.]|nr:PLP-dependent aminotransferase family protein [Microvirga sp.]